MHMSKSTKINNEKEYRPSPSMRMDIGMDTVLTANIRTLVS